jgi:prolyl-tRNA synthetase
MGGSASEEFLAIAETGEDTFVRSPGGYAANVEAVTTPAPEPLPYEGVPAAHAEKTPETPTIETLVNHLNVAFPRDDGRPWEAADTLKNVLVMLRHPDGTREPLAIGVPGDRDVDLRRLEAQVSPAEVEVFTDEDFAAHPGLAKGYIGPGALGEDNATGIRFLADPRIVTGTRWVTGADVDGSHVIDLVAGRDFTPDGIIDVAEVRAGDEAPDGSGPLELARGIEMGHIFQLGRKYADSLGLQVLDENGSLVTVTMGSYGVGVSRAVAAVVENSHDELGIVWPRQIAPYDVHVVATGKDEAAFEAADKLVAELESVDVEVLYDDRRKVSPGVKFKDAELLGMPTIVVVGKGLADGVVEVRDRATGERQDVPIAQAVDHLRGVCR